MWPWSRTRLALIAIVLALPLAAAQGIPTAPSAPGVPTPPSTPTLPGGGGELSIHENGLTFEGPADAPRRVGVVAPDGTTALDYHLDASGRASLDVAGTNVVSDATLLLVEGDPMGDAFTLLLRDPKGETHAVLVDKAALTANVELPPDAQLPAVDVLRPPSWPGAPSRSFLLNVQDNEPNLLPAAQLDGTRFLKLAGDHKAVVQIPAAEADFDRVTLRATRASSGVALNATFQRSHSTGDAIVFRASFLPGLLGLADADRVDVQPFYERRVTPLVVERFPDAGAFRYRVDGAAPTVSIAAPANADDFRFALSWDGADALSGVGSFTVDVRETGAPLWTRWLEKTPAKSGTFSGGWGRTYEFRAFALDAVGNPSTTPATATTVVKAQPGGTDDVNDPPTARLLTPATGAVVGGVASITWTATDPDATPVTSKLEVSADEGGTWRVLYVGAGTSHAWDTTIEEDGPGYRLRLTVSDGTAQAFDAAGALTVRNVVAPPAPVQQPSAQAPPTPPPPSPPPETAQPANAPASAPASADTTGTPPTGASPGAEEASAKKGIPAPFAAGAIVVAAALLARRKGQER